MSDLLDVFKILSDDLSLRTPVALGRHRRSEKDVRGEKAPSLQEQKFLARQLQHSALEHRRQRPDDLGDRVKLWDIEEGIVSWANSICLSKKLLSLAVPREIHIFQQNLNRSARRCPQRVRWEVPGHSRIAEAEPGTGGDHLFGYQGVESSCRG